MGLDRRTFVVGAGCFGIGAAISQALSAFEPAKLALAGEGSVKPTLSGKKLVPPNDGLIKVACALTRDVTLIDWVGPAAVFGAWVPDESLKRDRPLFEVFTVGETDPNFKLPPDYTFENAPQPQVIVVPGEADSAQLYEWLKKAHKSADVTMSVCYGARHLAKVGLLDGQAATTHHDYLDPYAKEFPQVHWVPDVRFTEGPNVSTSAGVTAGIDLSLRVFERYFGREKAVAAARALEHQGTGWMV
jgi:transcriptional regulator GlxA family with amidase domain